MSFHVFANRPFKFPHEKEQICKILDFLKSHYAQDQSNMCYCIFNCEYHHADGGLRGEYDIIVFTNHSISIIELKAKMGALIGHVTSNYKNENVQFKNLNGFVEEIRVSQIEDQKKHLLERLVNHFKRVMKKPNTEHYRIDSFLVFNDPLDLSQFCIEDDQIKKWFKVMTVQSFISEWASMNREQPFTMTEADVCYLAEKCFHLHEVESIDYEKNISSIQYRIQDFLDFESGEAYKSIDYPAIRRQILEYISESELNEMITMRRNILSLSDEQKGRFKSLISNLKIPYFSYARLSQFYLGEILKRIKSIASSATSVFLEMPNAVKNIDKENPIVPKLTTVNVNALTNTMVNDANEIGELLREYRSFCEMRYNILGKPTDEIKECERAALLIDLISKMEPMAE